MINLWLQESSPSGVADLLPSGWLSASELSRFQGMSSHRRRQQFIDSRWLLRAALSEQFNQSDWQIKERPRQLPLIENLPPGWCFSISHSQGLVGVSIADFRHGLDLEFINPERDFAALAEMFCAPEELTYIKENSAADVGLFYRFWCAKEAWFKALGAEQVGVRLSDMSYLKLKSLALPWYLYETEYQGYQLSVVGEGRMERLKIRLKK